jgi:CoA:oxalate CoA-transferase
LIVQALGGMISINGPEGGPGLRLGISLGDLAAGAFAAIAINAALYERRASGQGRQVDIAMLDVQTMLLENALVNQLALGVTAQPVGSRHPVIAPFDVFAAADGPIAIACANDHLFQLLCTAIGRPQLATAPEYATVFARYATQPALKAEIEAALAARTVAGWLEVLVAAGVPAAPVQTMADLVSDPQIAARGMIVEADDPEMGRLRMSGSPFKLSGYPERPTRPPAPNLDEARADILAELGWDPQDRRGRTKGPARPGAW